MLRAEPTIQIVIIIMLKSAINTSDEKSSRFLEESRERKMSSVAGKDFANPAAIAIPWIYSPVALELGTLSLKQPRHHGEFHLME